jgi:hypothetical protein
MLLDIEIQYIYRYYEDLYSDNKISTAIIEMLEKGWFLIAFYLIKLRRVMLLYSADPVDFE